MSQRNSLFSESSFGVSSEISIDTNPNTNILQKQHKLHTYYINFPDKQIYELTQRKPNKINGRVILQEICTLKGIKEIDSFGLQYVGRQGECLWLNLRNKIFEEIGKRPSRKRPQDFYRFYFRVKFYLHPQMVFTPGAKEVYFGEIRTKYLRGGFVLSLQEQISVSALMAQAELGPVSLYTREIEYGQFVPTNLKKGTETLFNACLCHKHKSLKDLNRHVCILRLLAVLSDNKEYGIQWYNRLHLLMTSDTSDSSQHIPVEMGIGPEFVYVCSPTGEELYSFHIGLVENLQRTNKGYCIVQLRGEDTMDQEVEGRLQIGGVTPYVSIELFRAMAERATFYLSDQIIEQIKEEIPVKQCQSWTGQESRYTVYTYDLIRNMKESYTDLLAELSSPRVSLLKCLPGTLGEEREGVLIGSQCKLCYDSFVSVVFKDCGHAVSCAQCLFKLSNCPVCRGTVKLSDLTPLITPLN